MDYSDVLGKLSYIGESDPDSGFSIARALSLPLDFLALLVRNRREAELLLNVSKCAASLDVLIQNYETIASRAHGLQEAWNGLWVSQEPYIVPAIPMIGNMMSEINSGRCVLLEKMHTEIKYLQDLGRQLSHYIDINYSLVEELRMEGIDRLAINKLLLVEVEKELAKRITCIGNSESIHGFSSIRQFLRDLTRNPIFISMTSGADVGDKEPADLTTNGSCSTEKATTDGVSERSGNRDVVSPDSQSFASKCITTQAENMNRLLTTGNRNLPLAKEHFHQLTLGLSTTSTPSNILTSGGSINFKLDVHNQCSSASEEMLPKLSTANGLYESPPTTSLKPVVDMGTDSTPHVNMLHMTVDRTLGVQKEKTDFNCSINYENQTGVANLLKDAVEQRSSAQVALLDDQVHSQSFQSHELDLNHATRKRPFEPNGITVVEDDVETVVRQSKRMLLQIVSERDGMTSGKASSATIHKTGTTYDTRNCQAEPCKALQRERTDTNGGLKFEYSICTCDHEIQNASANSIAVSNAMSSMEGRCRDCGCLQPQAFRTYGRKLFNLTPSCTPDDDLAVESSGIHVSESPMLATQ